MGAGAGEMKRVTRFLAAAFVLIAAWCSVHFGAVDAWVVHVDPRVRTVNAAVRVVAPCRAVGRGGRMQSGSAKARGAGAARPTRSVRPRVGTWRCGPYRCNMLRFGHISSPHPNPSHPHPRTQLPAWGLVALGCYALYCIGLGLFNFGDPGLAAEDLTKVRACGRGWWWVVGGG